MRKKKIIINTEKDYYKFLKYIKIKKSILYYNTYFVLENNSDNGCCRKCVYQTSSGCSTSNLTCKLFNCYEVKSRYKVLEYNDLELLRLLSIKNRIIVKSDYFSKREDVLKDLYSYSFIYSAIRIVCRLIKNYIHLKLLKNKVIV